MVVVVCDIPGAVTNGTSSSHRRDSSYVQLRQRRWRWRWQLPRTRMMTNRIAIRMILLLFTIVINISSIATATTIETVDTGTDMTPRVTIRLYSGQRERPHTRSSSSSSSLALASFAVIHAQCVFVHPSPQHRQEQKQEQNHPDDETNNHNDQIRHCCRVILIQLPSLLLHHRNFDRNSHSSADDIVDSLKKKQLQDDDVCTTNMIQSTFPFNPHQQPYQQEQQHPSPTNAPMTTTNNSTTTSIYSWVYTTHTNDGSGTGDTTPTIQAPLPYDWKNVSVQYYDNYNSKRSYTNIEKHNISDDSERQKTNGGSGDAIATTTAAATQSQLPRQLRVQLLTTLSLSGGMHRTMDHVLQFKQYHHHHHHHHPQQLPEQQQEYNVTLYMLFHLPSHLYINIEDCFQWNNNNINNSNSHHSDNDGSARERMKGQIQSIHIVQQKQQQHPSHPTVIIDQEEPEFVSPAHIVVAQIQVALLVIPISTTTATEQNDDTRTADTFILRVHFSTQLHVRYPKPFAVPKSRYNTNYTVNADTAAFRHSMIAPPILTSGHVANTFSRDRKTHNLNDNNRDSNQQQQQLRILIFVPDDDDVDNQDNKEQQQSILQIWIAGGHQSHFSMVVVTTIVMAMIGSIVMLYDISTVTIWI